MAIAAFHTRFENRGDSNHFESLEPFTNAINFLRLSEERTVQIVVELMDPSDDFPSFDHILVAYQVEKEKIIIDKSIDTHEGVKVFTIRLELNDSKQ